MIIDMRCRLTTKETAQYFSIMMAKSKFLADIPALEKGTVDTFFNEIEEAGITTAVSVSGNGPGITIGREVLPDRTTPNDLLAEVQKKYPGKFISVAGIDAGNVFHNALEELERCVKVLGMKAVFIEPGRSPGCLLNDRRLYPIYQKCVDLGVPLIPQTSGLKGAKNIDYANPRYIEEVAEDFPELNIICGHGCYPYVREMIVVAGRRHNVWASPDKSLLRLGTDDWVRAVNENDYGFADKFLFGSAYPFTPIKSYIDAFFKLGWKEEILDKILYKNAITALKLENDPVIREMYKL
ncbi:amidohydrolase family protein [Chloroflexota bacterium]